MEAAAEAEFFSRGCKHGLTSSPEEEICREMADALLVAHMEARCSPRDGFNAAIRDNLGRYPEVWNDPAKMQLAVCAFYLSGRSTSSATNVPATLPPSPITASNTAVTLRKSQFSTDWAKVYELSNADDRTIVGYFRKRIPCACLDEKHEEVKSTTKMGICFNKQCSTPGKRVERSAL